MTDVKNTPKASDLEKPLSHRERLFADHYLLTLNGREAAVHAGYKDGPGTAVAASRLLAKPHITAYIEARKKKFLTSSSSLLKECLRSMRV
jgi:phage terminase small subunit